MTPKHERPDTATQGQTARRANAHDHGHAGHHQAASSAATDRLKDPVCGMMVDPHTTPHRATHGGRTFYLCSAGCRQKFEADPARYFSPEQAKKMDAQPPEGAVYTCPMHPEVRQTRLGSCPICGMALEPVMAPADAGASAGSGSAWRLRFRFSSWKWVDICWG